MFERFRSSRSEGERQPQGAPGKRCYAIGDVHGRLDLLTQLMARIKADAAARRPKSTAIVMLGDLIDRGPDSRGVVEFLLHRPPTFADLYVIKGNHEEVLVRALSGEPNLLRSWLRSGGYQCAKSYGVEIGRLFGQDAETLEEILSHAIPADHIAYLESGLEFVRFGDYALVHAGVRPDVSLDDQRGRDLRWIRGDFLTSDRDHGAIIVHGHTITDGVERRPNRIGIDTGAYETGVLSALRIEDAECEVLQICGVKGEDWRVGQELGAS